MAEKKYPKNVPSTTMVTQATERSLCRRLTSLS